MELIHRPLSIRTIGTRPGWAGAMTTQSDTDTEVLKRYGRTHRTRRQNRKAE
jgi:hypothetical protein